jgi:maltooligosyltrehalose synthase
VRRLWCLEAWLDYALELGSSWLAQGSVFASHTRGYDTVDHFRIDPRLGHEETSPGWQAPLISAGWGSASRSLRLPFCRTARQGSPR